MILIILTITKNMTNNLTTDYPEFGSQSFVVATTTDHTSISTTNTRNEYSAYVNNLLNEMTIAADKINKCLLLHSGNKELSTKTDHLSDIEFTNEYLKFVFAKSDLAEFMGDTPIRLPSLLLSLIEPKESKINSSMNILHLLTTTQSPPLNDLQIAALKEDFGALQKHKYIGTHDLNYDQLDASSSSMMEKLLELATHTLKTIKHAINNLQPGIYKKIGLLATGNSIAIGFAPAWGIAAGLAATVAYTVAELSESWNEVTKQNLRQEINGIAFNNKTIFPAHEKLVDNANKNLSQASLEKRVLLMKAKIDQFGNNIRNNSLSIA
jgi:hypothetical protein